MGLVPPCPPAPRLFLPMLVRLCANFIAMVVLCAASTASAAESAAMPQFERDVLPILRAHCVRCHGPEKQESQVRLDKLSSDMVHDRAAAETWHEVLNALNAGEMPPAQEKQLSASERTTLTTWISDSIKRAVDARRDSDGRVVLRRLNRTEYQNTMTDLLGLEMDYARDLPPDPVSADGFLNDGGALQMTSLQWEYYLQSARRALDRVIVVGPAPKKHRYEFTKSNVGGWLDNPEQSNHLTRQQQFLVKMVDNYPEEGEFLVRVKLSAELKPDFGFPLLEVSVGYRPDTKILLREFDLVEITSAEEQTLEFRGRAENYPLPVRGQGKFPGLVVRVRNAYTDGSPLPKATKDKKNVTTYPAEPHLPSLLIKSVEFQGPVFDRWPPELHRRIMVDSPLREKDEAGYAGAVLEPFMRRACRRPVSKSEVTKMVDFYRSIRSTFPSSEEAMRETLAMVLIQPEFLYLIEPSGDKKRRVDDWELASRLSYFLWSTMPDARLFELAAKGTLHQPDVLSKEVERLLSDKRSARFVEQFAEQWLQLQVVDAVAVSQKQYPGFDDTLKIDMRGETTALVAELVQRDLSAMNLIASDFTMLNERLAKHYGVTGVLGNKFRRVALKPEQHRGGLLGQAAILLSNSTGADSHPVRRAVWIRDRLLNDPPAPPPPDAPSLEEADPSFLKLSVREQLEVHRKKEACASCHRNIDPWGITLENFDAIGLWRDELRRSSGGKIPVNAGAVLPTGRRLTGADGLRDYLTNDRKDDFTRSLIVRLLTYALGRQPELSDQRAIDDLSTKFTADGYRMRRLIHAIVQSEPFQTK
jgi:mono/diheme cytochrome c family protein